MTPLNSESCPPPVTAVISLAYLSGSLPPQDRLLSVLVANGLVVGPFSGPVGMLRHHRL